MAARFSLTRAGPWVYQFVGRALASSAAMSHRESQVCGDRGALPWPQNSAFHARKSATCQLMSSEGPARSVGMGHRPMMKALCGTSGMERVKNVASGRSADMMFVSLAARLLGWWVLSFLPLLVCNYE